MGKVQAAVVVVVDIDVVVVVVVVVFGVETKYNNKSHTKITLAVLETVTLPSLS
jgi:hypothetical protein